MLTAAQVAAQLGISARAVYDLPIPRFKFGRAVRYEQADVDAYKASTPPAGLIPARYLRELARLQSLAGAPSSLTPAQLEIAQKRYRRIRLAPWADSAAVRAIYEEAKRLTAETGIEHHVDHDIPLLGEFVSGLHVETNLRILPKADNIRKRNRYEVK